MLIILITRVSIYFSSLSCLSIFTSLYKHLGRTGQLFIFFVLIHITFHASIESISSAVITTLSIDFFSSLDRLWLGDLFLRPLLSLDGPLVVNVNTNFSAHLILIWLSTYHRKWFESPIFFASGTWSRHFWLQWKLPNFSLANKTFSSI